MSLKIMAETLRIFGGAGYYPGLNGRGKELIEFGDRIDPIASAMLAFVDAPPQLFSPALFRRADD